MYKEKLKLFAAKLFLKALDYKLEYDIHGLLCLDPEGDLFGFKKVVKAIKRTCEGRSIDSKGKEIFYNEYFEGRNDLEKAMEEFRMF